MGLAMGFTVRRGSEKGSQKGFSEGGFQKVPRTPPRRVRPLGVRPRKGVSGKFRRCWKILPQFSNSTKGYPSQGLGSLWQIKRSLENQPRLRERSWISPPKPPQLLEFF